MITKAFNSSTTHANTHTHTETHTCAHLFLMYLHINMRRFNMPKPFQYHHPDIPTQAGQLSIQLPTRHSSAAGQHSLHTYTHTSHTHTHTLSRPHTQTQPVRHTHTHTPPWAQSCCLRSLPPPAGL